jgi:hypothetical protein
LLSSLESRSSGLIGLALGSAGVTLPDGRSRQAFRDGVLPARFSWVDLEVCQSSRSFDLGFCWVSVLPTLCWSLESPRCQPQPPHRSTCMHCGVPMSLSWVPIVSRIKERCIGGSSQRIATVTEWTVAMMTGVLREERGMPTGAMHAQCDRWPSLVGVWHAAFRHLAGTVDAPRARPGRDDMRRRDIGEVSGTSTRRRFRLLIAHPRSQARGRSAIASCCCAVNPRPRPIEQTKSAVSAHEVAAR